MQIKTKLGSLALAISAQAKADKMDEISAIAGASLTYRAGGSALFGKKSSHSREEAFGDKLKADGIAAVEAALKPFFDSIEVLASAYVKPAPKGNEAARKAMQESLAGLGLSDEQIAEALDKAFPLPELQASEEAEAGEEAVG